MATQRQYLPKRVLRTNVGFLLNDGPAHVHEASLDLPRVQVDDDLMLDYVQGPMRLSRTKEGILLQAELMVGVRGECYRCLRGIAQDVAVQLEELYATTHEIDSEFRIGDDAMLDLAPLLRAEVIIATTRGIRCDDEAACTQRMTVLQDGDAADALDPRLAVLRSLLKPNG